MIWGSYYPDAPKIFLTDQDLINMWGKGERNFLFVPEDSHDHVLALLGSRAVEIESLAGKTLYTDRPPFRFR
jgi:hypothetical protein